MDHVDQPARPTRPTRPPQLSPDIIVSALSGVFVLVLGGLASRMDPDKTLVPLVSSEDRLYYVAAILLSVLVGVASATIRSNQTAHTPSPIRLLTPAIVLPTIAVGGAGLLFAYNTNWGIILLAAVGVGATAWLVTWAESRITTGLSSGPPDSLAPVVHLAVTVAVGLLILSTIYGFKMNMRYTAPLVFLSSGALLCQALGGSRRPRRYIPVTLAAALLLTEMAWVLLYWNIAAWHGGAILGLGFYTLLAVVGGYLAGGLQGRDLVRQAMISAPVLALLVLAAR